VVIIEHFFYPTKYIPFNRAVKGKINLRLKGGNKIPDKYAGSFVLLDGESDYSILFIYLLWLFPPKQYLIQYPGNESPRGVSLLPVTHAVP
jgi:hypothetical protein